jgi:hypothetical protein
MYEFTNGGRFYKNKYSEFDIKEYGGYPPYGLNCYNVFFFHKKDTTKFDRFNSKEIQELRKFNLTVAAISNRVMEYYANSKFKNESFEEWYNFRNSIYQYSIGNYDFGGQSTPYKTFFKNSKKEHEMLFGDKKNRNAEAALPTDSSIESLFFIIPKKQNSSIGLGLLDDDSLNEKNFKEKFYFFNTIPNNNFKIIK